MWKNVHPQRWDSNPQPLKHESSPITTRPGLINIFNWFVISQGSIECTSFYLAKLFQFFPPNFLSNLIIIWQMMMMDAQAGRN